MNKEELLNLYLKKLYLLSLEALEEEENLTVMESIKKSLIFLEGEFSGY